MKRIIFDIVLCICFISFPWWVTAIFAFIGIFIFTQFYEFVIASAAMYILYRVPSSLFFASPFWFTAIVAFIYIGTQTLRQYIIIYKYA